MEEKFKKLYTKNLNWSIDTFGSSQNILKLLLKFKEEMKELEIELVRKANGAKNLTEISNEIADLMILLQQFVGFTTGYDTFLEILERKIDNNINRKWELQPDGTWKHIKE
jgi:hypothetical protein